MKQERKSKMKLTHRRINRQSSPKRNYTHSSASPQGRLSPADLLRKRDRSTHTPKYTLRFGMTNYYWVSPHYDSVRIALIGKSN